MYHILLEQLSTIFGTFLDFVPPGQVSHVDERNYDKKNGANQGGLEFGRRYKTKVQEKRRGHLQTEIHDCRFLKFWSFISWITPDTQNTALKDRKLSRKIVILIAETY